MRAPSMPSPLRRVARWALASLLLAVSGAALAQDCTMPLQGGGTNEAPFDIAGATAFTSMTDRFAELADAGSTTDACWSASFELTDDVDLTGVNFVPVGFGSDGTRNEDVWFRGAFDGGGHAIRSLRIVSSKTDVALFGGLEDATLRNLTFEDSFVSSSDSRVAVVAGDAKGLTVANVTISGADVTGRTAVGTLAGRASGGTWTDVVVRGSTVDVVETSESSNNLRGGGLVGNLRLASDTTVRRPRVDVEVEGGPQIGGLFGRVTTSDTEHDLTVTGGTVRGTLRGGNATGGMIGRLFPDVTFVAEGGTVDVDVEPSARLSTTLSRAGGVVGKVAGRARIEGVTVRADVGSSSGIGNNVGGVIGIVENGSTRAEVVATTVSGTTVGDDHVGGVVGHVDKGTARIEGVVWRGVVSGTNAVGGVIGEVSQDTTLVDVDVDGKVEADQGAGGLVGQLVTADLTATRAVVDGTVEATASNGNANTAGVLGRMDRESGLDPSVTLEAVDVLADVTSTNGRGDVGGAVGKVDPGGAVTLRDVRIAGDVTGGDDTGGFVGRLRAAGGTASTLDLRRGLLVGAVSEGGATGPAVVGAVGADNATSIRRVEAFVPADVDGSPALGTPLGADALTDPRTFLDAGWSLVNGPEGSAVWRSCDGAEAPQLAWYGAPEGCAPVDFAEGLAVATSSRSLLQGVPFDVVVSVVDAEGVAFPAATAGTVELRGEGGAEPGVLRFASDVDGGAPVVDVAAGVERVTFTDVVYTGLSDVSGGDVVLSAVGGGGLEGLRGVAPGVSVRDVRTTVAIDRDAVVADGVDQATVTVTVQRADGTPIEGKPVTLSTTIGSFVVEGRSVGASVDRTTDPEGVVAVGLRSDGSVGTAEVSVSCPGACDVTASVDFVEAAMPFTVVPGNGVAWVYPGFGDAVETVEIRVGPEGETGTALSSSDVRGPVRLEGLENGVAYDVEVDALDGGGEVLETRSGTVTPGPVAPPVLGVSVDRAVAPVVEEGASGTLVTVRMRVTHEESGPLERAWFVVGVPEGVSVVRATNVSRGSVAPEPVAWRWVGAAWPAGEVLSFDVTFRVAP